MKRINEYLSTKVNVSHDDYLMQGVDYKKWKWRSSYSEDNYLRKCKETVKNFAKSSFAESLYPNVKKDEILEMMYRDTYKAFMSADTNQSEQEIEKMCNDQMKLLNKIKRELGWGQYEYSCLEQGWWVFIAWVIDEKYR